MFVSPYEEFIYKSRYARWLPEHGRREDYPETVDRYLSFMQGHLLKKHNYVVPEADVTLIRNELLNIGTMPSMRALMTAGEALDRSNVAGYNCSNIVVDDLAAFHEAMFILLNGTGVGYSIERQFTDQLPALPANFRQSDAQIVVEDSKEGWVEAFRLLLKRLFRGEVCGWDTRKVRPAGARLKTFGGRASGPEPLERLFRFTVDLITQAGGRKLEPIECHDLMCVIAEIVVVGGVRRSAMISLSDLNDSEMANAKADQEVVHQTADDYTVVRAGLELVFSKSGLNEWDRAKIETENKVGWWVNFGFRTLANISAVYESRPTPDVFLHEWATMIASKAGERGFFNREAAQNQAAKYGRRERDTKYGTNPCCVSGETPILTDQGYQEISDVIGKETWIWNGEDWAEVVPYEAGEAELYRVHLSDGTYLDCTANHRWCIEGVGFVTTNDLTAGQKLEKFLMPVVLTGETWDVDPYSQGFYSAEGNVGRTWSWVYAPKYAALPHLTGKIKDHSEIYGRRRWVHGVMLDKQFVPVNGEAQWCLRWLAGLLDGDGSVCRHKNGISIQIASVNKEFLQQLRLMLTRLGVQAKIGLMRKDGHLFDGYTCQAVYRLCINSSDTAHLVALGLPTRRVDATASAPQRDARRFVTVERVEDLDQVEMTYCFTEPKTSRGTFNGIVTGNSEIILRPNSFCNLSEVIVRAEDTLNDLKRKTKVATILGTWQATLTDFPVLRPIWKQNAEEERLLGVSLTGIMDHPVLQTGDQEWLEQLRLHAVEVNKERAAAIGINPSVAITCVKPSGTVSQLTNTASGLHARFSPYYVRTVRADNKDPITTFMKDQGVPNEPCQMRPEQTTIFSFPIASPEGAVCQQEMGAIHQLEVWKALQDHWCEHKPSCTVTVRDEEWCEVGAWVYKHFDSLSGISFMPHSDHVYAQAPYQPCDKATYLIRKAAMPVSINWSLLANYEHEDNTKGSQTVACSAGVCEIVDL